MKLGAVSSIAIATPVAVGAGGFILTRENRMGRINDAFQKASSDIRRNEEKVNSLKRMESRDLIPVKRINLKEAEKGIIFHMLERQKVNGCSYKIKMGNQEYSLDNVLKANKDMSNNAGRAFLELDVTKDWRKYGKGIVDSACFKSENITVERNPSSTWNGWYYWLVTGRDKNNKEVYRSWFWQQ